MALEESFSSKQSAIGAMNSVFPTKSKDSGLPLWWDSRFWSERVGWRFED